MTTPIQRRINQLRTITNKLLNQQKEFFKFNVNGQRMLHSLNEKYVSNFDLDFDQTN